MARKKKQKNNLIKCPLFVAVCMTVIGVMLYGFIVAYYGNYEFSLSWDRPAFVALVLGEKTEVETEVVEEEETELALEIMEEETEVATEEYSEEAAEEATEETDEYVSNEVWDEEGNVHIVADSVTEYTEWNDNEPRGRFYTNPGVRPLSTDYPYQQVDIDYFENSIFIGDSRIEGLSYYGGIDTATFVYKTGMSIYGVMDRDMKMKVGTEVLPDTVNLLDVLEARQYENIYIMLGINELGNATSSFSRQYAKVLGEIRKRQPEARIIIMGIMFVTNGYDRNPAVFNNDNVNSKNVAISRYANGRTIYYLDMNPAVEDENHALNSDYTFDGVHLTAQYYNLWRDFMCSHAY